MAFAFPAAILLGLGLGWWLDKHFRTWNYLSFDTYCFKELGIRQTTASKLLKSYSFIEKEEPRLASAAFSEEEKLFNFSLGTKLNLTF